MDHKIVGIVKAQAHTTAESMVMGVEPSGVLVCGNMERWIRGHWRKTVITTSGSISTAGYWCKVVDTRKGSRLLCCLSRCSIYNLGAMISSTTNYKCLVASEGNTILICCFATLHGLFY